MTYGQGYGGGPQQGYGAPPQQQGQPQQGGQQQNSWAGRSVEALAPNTGHGPNKVEITDDALNWWRDLPISKGTFEDSAPLPIGTFPAVVMTSFFEDDKSFNGQLRSDEPVWSLGLQIQAPNGPRRTYVRIRRATSGGRWNAALKACCPELANGGGMQAFYAKGRAI
jgi:hypothetical protein